MINLFTQFGEASQSGIGALGFNGRAFIIQLVTFILVFLVLRRYAFKPILKVLSERRETIEKGVKLGEQMQKEQAELEKKVTKALHEARRQADDILASADAAARQSAQQAEEKARTKAEGILTSAEDRIKQETSQARQKLEKELAGLVAEATEAVIDEKMDAKKDSEIINRALKESQAA